MIFVYTDFLSFLFVPVFARSVEGDSGRGMPVGVRVIITEKAGGWLRVRTYTDIFMLQSTYIGHLIGS